MKTLLLALLGAMSAMGWAKQPVVGASRIVIARCAMEPEKGVTSCKALSRKFPAKRGWYMVDMRISDSHPTIVTVVLEQDTGLIAADTAVVR